MRFADARILIFAKAPLAGQVKTRLVPALGAAGAARLYAGLLRHVVSELAGPGLCPVQCWCAPHAGHVLFPEFAAHHRLTLHTQAGADLGERMFNAARFALHDAERVVLVGGDCPGLTAEYTAEALGWLDNGADAVLGPAADGGYVLLGLRRPAAQLFEDMPWGTDRVLEETRGRLRALGWRWRELAELWDVDRPEDLARLEAHAVTPNSKAFLEYK